jgi:butyrate kinase
MASRTRIIASYATARYQPESLQAVVGRGGLSKPIPGGTYKVKRQDAN